MVTGLVNTRLIQPLSVVTISVTLYIPEAANSCVGFCKVDVLAAPLDGSLKFHAQLVRFPAFATDASVNEIVLVSQEGVLKL